MRRSGGGGRGSRGSRDARRVRFEPAVDGLDRVMHGSLDDGQIQECDEDGTSRGRRGQCLHGDGIPIGHRIGVHCSCPTQPSTDHEAYKPL